MPRKLIVLLAIAATALVAMIAGALAWDANRDDLVAKGIRVGPVDVGAMTRSEARAALQQRLAEPLHKPLVVRSAGRPFRLTERGSHIAADVDAMVEEAIQRGREGGVLARTWRAITGGEVNARVTPKVRYSEDAVDRLAIRVRAAVGYPAKDARVSFKPKDVAIRPSSTGRTIDTKTLRVDVREALTTATTTAARTITAPIQTLQPKVSGKKLAARYPVLLKVDRGRFRIALYKNLKPAQIYPIAVGQAGLETPPGLYKIQNKAINPAWSVPNSPWAGSLAGTVIPGGTAGNPLKARWLGVYDGVGVHGTSDRGSIGSNASHGCIRMLVEDVVKLYDEVPVGTPIYIA
jgi:lipoprotein-anchoring transpeptidase ErfK/SrfK